MKIPQILAQQPVPAGFPAAQASPRVFSAVGEAIAQGGAQLEDVALRAFDARRQANVAKQRIKAETEAARLQADAEVTIAEFDANLRRTVLDPDEYRRQYRDGVGTIREDILGQAQEAGTKDLLSRKLPGFLAAREVASVAHADQLFVNGRKGALTRTLDQREQLAGLAPLSDTNEFVRQFREGAGAIEATRPVVGDDETERALIAFRERVFAERARRHVNENPADFLAEIEGGSFYNGMDPTRRDALVTQAQGKIEARQRETDRRQREAEARNDKEIKIQQEEAEVRAFQMFEAGTLTKEWLNDAASMRLLSSEKLEHFSKILDKRAQEGPPLDATLWREIVSEAFDTRTNPVALADRVRRLMAEGRLPVNDDTEQVLRHLQSEANRRVTEGRVARNEGERLARERRSEARQVLGQAEQMLEADLRVTGPLEKIVPEAQNALALAKRELWNASAGGGGSKDAMAVYEGIKSKYIGMTATAAAGRQTVLRNIIGTYTPASLKAARGRIPDEEYYRIADALRDLATLQTEIQALQAGRAK